MSPADEARRQVAELSRLLKQRIREAGWTATAVSEKLGRGKKYLTRVFAGKMDLTLADLLGIFDTLGQRPEPFFFEHYPIAGESSPGGGGPSWLFAAGELKRMMAHALAQRPLPPAGELIEAAGRILHAMIVGASSYQRAVSRALGLADDSLADALRAANRLTVFHIFGTLHVIGRRPGRFFAELFMSGFQPGAEFQVDAAVLLDLFERLLLGTQEAAEGEPTKDDDEGGKGPPPSKTDGKE